MTYVRKTVQCKNSHALYFGPIITPQTAVSETALSFGTVQVRRLSAAQTFAVSGQNLSANIVINAPAGFYITLDGSDTANNVLNLAPAGGVVNQIVYVKFAPDTYQVYAPANITIACTGLATLNIAVDGTGTLQTNLKNWYDALTGAKPSPTRTFALQGLWLGLEEDYQIGNSDFFHVMLGLVTEEQNLNPVHTTGVASMVKVGTPTLDANGFTGDGVSSYINLKWKADGNGVQYQLNSACAMYYCRSTTPGGSNGVMQPSKSNSVFNPLSISNDHEYSITNDPLGPGTSKPGGSAKGLWTVKRMSGVLAQLELNTAVISSDNVNVGALSTLEEYLGAVNNNGTASDFDDRNYCLIVRGNRTLDPAKILARLTAYATEIGITL